jgi:DNA invertase Pin-like site-specific DNA recombinase
LLVAKLDRLTRSVKDLGILVETYFLAGRWSLMSVSEQIDPARRRAAWCSTFWRR